MSHSDPLPDVNRIRLFSLGNICSASTGDRGDLLSLSGSPPSSWTQYRFNITATSTAHTIFFRFDVSNSDRYYMDTVSVTNVNTPGTEILTNPSFESSSTSLVGWSSSSTIGCGSTAGVTSGTRCYLSTGNCLIDQCVNAVETISQTFATVPGNKYSVSFRLLITISGGSSGNRFYFDWGYCQTPVLVTNLKDNLLPLFLCKSVWVFVSSAYHQGIEIPIQTGRKALVTWLSLVNDCRGDIMRVRTCMGKNSVQFSSHHIGTMNSSFLLSSPQRSSKYLHPFTFSRQISLRTSPVYPHPI